MGKLGSAGMEAIGELMNDPPIEIGLTRPNGLLWGVLLLDKSLNGSLALFMASVWERGGSYALLGFCARNNCLNFWMA